MKKWAILRQHLNSQPLFFERVRANIHPVRKSPASQTQHARNGLGIVKCRFCFSGSGNSLKVCIYNKLPGARN